jgi:hypothetical protein
MEEEENWPAKQGCYKTSLNKSHVKEKIQTQGQN